MADSDKYHNGRNGHIPLNGNQRANHYANQEQNTSEGDDDEIDLKKLFYLLYNRKWLIIGTVIVCGILAGVFAYLTTPIYESDGTIMISDSQGGRSSFKSDNGIANILSSAYGLGAGSTLMNEIQILKSRKLSRAIADSVLQQRTMENGKEFPLLYKSYPDDSTIIGRETVATRIRGNITFTRLNPKADVVQISYQSPSPLEAAFLVNTSMNKYSDLSRNTNRSSASSALTFLDKDRSRVHTQLDSSENQLRIFMNNSDLVQVDAQTQQLIKQMATLETNMHTAKVKLVAANSAIKKYNDELNSIKPGLADQFSQAVGPRIIRLQHALAELQLEKAKLTTNYPRLEKGERNSPKLKKINRKISSYNTKIKNLTEKSIGKNDQYLSFIGGDAGKMTSYVSKLNQKLIQLTVQKEQNQAQVDVISKQLAQQKKFFQNLPDNIIHLARLKRDVQINSQLYKTISDQYAQTKLWEQTQFGLGQVVDNGLVPKKPIKPRKKLYVLVGFILGGILSVGFVLVRDAFNKKINSVEMLRRKQVPLLSVIPQFKEYLKEKHGGKETEKVQGKKLSTDLVTLFDTLSPVSEAFRRLQNNLIYTNPD